MGHDGLRVAVARREGRGKSPAFTVGFEEWLEACMSGDDDWRSRMHAYNPTRLLGRYVFLNGRPVVDVLIRQEAIDERLREVGRRLGITLRPLGDRENRTHRRRDYRSYYSDGTAESLGHYFSDIIALCGYAFDPAGRR